MSAARKLKELLAELAAEFGVTKGQMWDAVKGSSGGFGPHWNTALYVRRPPTADETAKFKLPEKAVVLTITGSRRPTFFVCASYVKGQDQVERMAVVALAYGLQYLASICLRGDDAHLP